MSAADESEGESRVGDIEEVLGKSVDQIFRLMNNYESIVLEIQNEAKQFQCDNQNLRQKLSDLITENEQLRLQSQEATNVSFNKFQNDFIAVTDRTILNLQNQILMINKEKEMFENLWQNTADVLEREVPFNSISKMQVQHALEVKKLKEELITLSSNLEAQNKSNQFLKQNLRMILKEVKELQVSCNDLSEKLKTCEDDKKEIEKMFEDSNALNKEQMQKSVESFAKLQETLEVAGAAMAEVEALSIAKKQIETEYNILSETIFSVMESASEKVDKVVVDLKLEHQKENETLTAEIERLRQMIQLEEAKALSAIEQIGTLKQQIKLTESANSYLLKDLKAGMHSVTVTGEKVSEMKRAIDDENRFNKLCQLEIQKRDRIIENLKRSKEKWKVLLTKITMELEAKINELMKENVKPQKSTQKNARKSSRF